MIRLRDSTGKASDLPDGIVEVCDAHGNIAFAVYQEAGGRVVILEPNTPEGDRYAKIFKVTWAADHVTLPAFLTEVNIRR